MIAHMETIVRSALDPLDDIQKRPDRRADGPLDRRQEGKRLAAALRSLIARDEAPPPLWLSLTFAHGVDAIRASLAGIESTGVLVRSARGLLEPVDPEGTPFAALARRLARDPAAVALGLRWLEIDLGCTLPPWPDLVRRRRLGPVDGDPVRDAAIWFG
jgi:hypothetical protein